MRERRLRAFLSTVVLAGLAWLAIPMGASAHSDLPPTLHITPERPVTGDLVEISGTDFAADSSVELLLVTSADSRLLGTAPTDAEGHFAKPFFLPGDLPAGTWELRAQDLNGATGIGVFETGQGTYSGSAATAPSGNSAWSARTRGWDPMMLAAAGMLGASVVVPVFLFWRASRRSAIDRQLPMGDDPLWSGVRSKS